MDYPCGKFGDWFYHADRRTDAQTHAQTDMYKPFTPATVVGVSKYA